MARKTLENLIVKDRWTDNQEFVDGSLEVAFVDDVKTFTNYRSAKEYLESFHVLNGGFDLKMKTFNSILYVRYHTRLKTLIKESTDPANAVWATNGNGQPLVNNYRAHIALVGGKGHASSENIPTPDEPKKDEPKAPNTNKPGHQTQQLPNTGTTTSILSLIGVVLFGLIGFVSLKKKNN